ncbi:MAG: glycosyltransferase family 2 protein [Candidatus Omnitrophica bacterium]|nr:glycosyltransferase family 2 protein [Candidatus Omnitrophota bacterium]
MSKKIKISAFLVVRNEGKNIERALKSLNFCDEIIIIDQKSTDDTVEKSKKYTKKIYCDKEWGYCEPSRILGEKLCKGEWILNIDADEEVTYELKKEILKAIKKDEKDVYGLKRLIFYLGHPLKHLSRTNEEKGVFRLHKKNAVKYSKVLHTDAIPRKGARIGILNNPLNHYPFCSFEQHAQKIKRYAKVIANTNKKYNSFPRKYFGIFYLPIFYFAYHYVYKKGFLDGLWGLIFCLNIFVYELLIYKYIWWDNALSKFLKRKK